MLEINLEQHFPQTRRSHDRIWQKHVLQQKLFFCSRENSKITKIMMFISDVQNYVPMKLCKTADSIHLFKIRGMLKPENIKLNKNYLWDMMEIDWKEVTMTFNDNKINLCMVVCNPTPRQNQSEKINEQRTTTFSQHDKARNSMIYSSIRNTRSNINTRINFQCFNFRWFAF